MGEWPQEIDSQKTSKKEKTPKELQWELSRTGWDLDQERREERIFELKEPFRIILRELAEDINSGKIQTLIGDDASGRIPTLILRNCIAEIYSENNMPAPRTFFINGPGGGSELNDEQREKRVGDIAQHFKQKMPNLDPDKKILLITEAISSGGSISLTLDACKQLGVPVEIVSVGIEGDNGKGYLEKMLGVKVYSGMGGTPLIYDSPAFAGVYKEKPHQTALTRYPSKSVPLFSQPYKKQFEKRNQAEKQLWLNEIRREMHVLSDELLEQYKNMNSYKENQE